MTWRRLSWLGMTLGVSLVMLSALAGGCFRPEDTYVNYSNASGSGAGPGGTGGGQTADTPRAYFELEVREDMVINCGKSGCHNSGEVGFLTVGVEYETITTWHTKAVAPGTPLLIPNPSKSLLVTYPGSADHSGVNWDEGLEDLRERVLTWLELEADNLPEDAFLEIGPVKPKGLMVLPLDTLSPELAGFSMSFYASEHGHPPSLLELTQISMWPPNGRGLRVENVTFVIQPPINVAPILDKSFHGDAQVFVAPQAVTVGPGELVLTEWGPDYALSVRFGALTPLFADGDGNTYTPCTRVDLFVQGVEDLPIQSSPTSPNGLLYCADQCHGGNKGTAPTSVMDMAELLIDPRDYPFVCAKVKPFITPSNVDGSLIISATNPLGSSPHLFSFGGTPSAHNAFKTAMTPWIEQEGLK